jgi:hypothetical protein
MTPSPKSNPIEYMMSKFQQLIPSMRTSVSRYWIPRLSEFVVSVRGTIIINL